MRAWIRPLSLVRALTPAGLGAVIVALVCGMALVLGGLGFRWDPLDLSRRRLETADRGRVEARAEAAARSAEARGQAGQMVRLDAALLTTRALDRATEHALQNARTADDAALPLPTDRADRLRDHDRELCRIAPELVGCTPPPEPADHSEPSM